jgi:hypothetical protein
MALTAPWKIEEGLVSFAFLISCLRLIFTDFLEIAILQVCVKAFWLCGGQADRAVSWSKSANGEDEPDESTVNNTSWAFIKPT